MTLILEQPEELIRRHGARTRMCAVTRRVLPEAELIRFVAGPDGLLVPDLKAKLPGRGIWIGASRAMVEQAQRKGVFRRGLRQPVLVPPELPDMVALRLRDAALGRLGLARKAGAAVAGFAKVEAAIGNKTLAALLTASDAADDGERKIGQALRRRFGAGAPFPVVGLFSSEELGLAMGLPNVIHAAVLQGPAGMSFAEAVLRLRRFDGAGPGESGIGRPGGHETGSGIDE